MTTPRKRKPARAKPGDPLPPDALTFDPPLTRHATTSARISRDRDLKAWQRGERPGLRVLHGGREIAPAEVDWSKVDTGSGTPTSGTPAAGRVALTREADAQLDALAERWGVPRAQAAARAIREAHASEK